MWRELSINIAACLCVVHEFLQVIVGLLMSYVAQTRRPYRLVPVSVLMAIVPTASNGPRVINLPVFCTLSDYGHRQQPSRVRIFIEYILH